MQINNLHKRKIFLTTLNAGIQTIATGFQSVSFRDPFLPFSQD
jgi:hypothetical protein